MKKTTEEQRLKAIKQIIAIGDIKCRSCGNYFSFTKMWKVDRWGASRTIHSWCYCKECMKSKEEVLYEIDTDSCRFGIAHIDPFLGPKKDLTRYNEKREKIYNLSYKPKTLKKEK